MPPRQAGRPSWTVPTTPNTQRPPTSPRIRFSLLPFRSPLLRESLLLPVPVGTEMFQFPTFPPTALYIQTAVTRHHSGWVSPFGHPRITARLTAPRGLSRPPTSFIGSWCQGIHRTPKTLATQKDARIHYPVPKQQPHQGTAPSDTRQRTDQHTTTHQHSTQQHTE